MARKMIAMTNVFDEEGNFSAEEFYNALMGNIRGSQDSGEDSPEGEEDKN